MIDEQSGQIVDASIPINRTHLRAVTLFAPKDDIRYYLNGVLLQITATAVRLVATEGRMLVVAQTEFADGCAPNTEHRKILIPVDVCKRFAADKDKTPIYVSPLPGINRFKMESAGLSINFTPIEGSYPDYENAAIFPTQTNGAAAQHQPEFIARFGKAAAILGSKDVQAVYIEHNGEGPAIVHFSDADVIGILMPLRVAGTIGLPKWLKPRSALADMESASGNLPGVESKEDAADDKPLNTAGNADAPPAGKKRASRREAKANAEAAFS